MVPQYQGCVLAGFPARASPKHFITCRRGPLLRCSSWLCTGNATGFSSPTTNSKSADSLRNLLCGPCLPSRCVVDSRVGVMALSHALADRYGVAVERRLKPNSERSLSRALHLRANHPSTLSGTQRSAPGGACASGPVMPGLGRKCLITRMVRSSLRWSPARACSCSNA